MLAIVVAANTLIFIYLWSDHSRKTFHNHPSTTIAMRNLGARAQVPKFFVLTRDVFTGRGSNPDWLNQAVFRSAEAFSYERFQEGMAKYVRNFAYEVKNTGEHFFVLTSADYGSGRVDLFRLREEPIPIIDQWIWITRIAAILTATMTLVSYWSARPRNHVHR